MAATAFATSAATADIRPDAARSGSGRQSIDTLTMALIAALPALMWLALLLLPWRPWSTRERLEVTPAASGPAPDDADAAVTAIVPARDEAAHIARTLAGLRAQSPTLRIIVVDDQSSDGTGSLARTVPGVEVVDGAPLPEGWTGKLWALEQGIARASSPLLLFVDADIELSPGVLEALRQRQADGDRGLVSVMAALSMASPWERLLMPAFIYFFKLIYPFALANGPSRRFHGAAGGCMLLRADALVAVGGVAGLRDAVIDDCTLARRLKAAGFRTWLGLTRAVVSTRRYRRLADTWNMVARTAYTQLGCSVPALLACSVLLVLAFLAPILLLVVGGAVARALSATALAAMVASYLPVVRYYALPHWLALTLPLAAVLFLAMTWSSAVGAWRGVRARWKDRAYASVVIAAGDSTRGEPPEP